MTRISWFRALLGFSLGLIIGVFVAQEVNPFHPTESEPSELEPAFQDEYRLLVAIAYDATSDLERALQRLELLDDPDPSQTFGALAQQILAEGRPEDEARAAAQLSAVLLQESAAQPSTITPTASNRPVAGDPTETARPSISIPPTPTFTPIPAFQLVSKDEICDPDLVQPLIQVQVFDSEGDPLPAVEVVVIWDMGEDHFFTGMKPEIGLGYADFTMEVGVTYSLYIAGSGSPVNELQMNECTGVGREAFPGSWLLTFEAS
ncbi:MAG: hypothetical protein GTO18_03365 [Anaerolineales bacterium]|nr:hypothetical protein [Anaerolineales bacterium]